MQKMNDGGKVSIVLPVYNGEQYLKGAMESCLNQTYKNIELIIVDDCSTDSTPDIIKSFTDDRIRYICHEKNKRLPGALNTGFKIAKGNYLTWTSDDNEYFPNAIETMLLCLSENPGTDLVYADYKVIDVITGESSTRSLQSPLELKENNGMGACFLYTRRVYNIIGEYNPALYLVEDYDYWIRTAKAFNTCHCNQTLYLYRNHPKSLTLTKYQKIYLLDKTLKHYHGYLSDSDLSKCFVMCHDEIIYKRSSITNCFSVARDLARTVSTVSPVYNSMFNKMFCKRILLTVLKKIGIGDGSKG